MENNVKYKNISYAGRNIKLDLPLDFARKLGISKDSKGVNVYMQDDKIVIEKAN